MGRALGRRESRRCGERRELLREQFGVVFNRLTESVADRIGAALEDPTRGRDFAILLLHLI
jgi:hypothetical protein